MSTRENIRLIARAPLGVIIGVIIYIGWGGGGEQTCEPPPCNRHHLQNILTVIRLT